MDRAGSAMAWLLRTGAGMNNATPKLSSRPTRPVAVQARRGHTANQSLLQRAPAGRLCETLHVPDDRHLRPGGRHVHQFLVPRGSQQGPPGPTEVRDDPGPGFRGVPRQQGQARWLPISARTGAARWPAARSGVTASSAPTTAGSSMATGQCHKIPSLGNDASIPARDAGGCLPGRGEVRPRLRLSG